MAKKVTIPRRGSAPRKSVRGWLPLALAGVALAGGLMALLFDRNQAGFSGQAKLPARPDVSGRPAELGRLLGAAMDRVRAESASPASVAALGGIYHVNKLPAEAEACWLFLHEQQPREARWCYYLAAICRRRVDESGLRSWLEQTVRLAPDYAPAWLELGDLEFKTGHRGRAGGAYRQRLRLIPGDPYASLGLARVALQEDRRAEGKALIEALVKSAPAFPSSHNIYAEILAQDGDKVGAANQRWLGTVAGRFRAAPDPWKEELRAACCDVDQLIVWGAIDFQTRHGDRGKACFEKAVSLEPRNPQGYENLGMYYLEVGDAAKAVAVLEQGSVLPRASELLFSSLGDAYLALQRPEQAREMADTALQTIPGSMLMHNLRGLALAAEHQPEKAIEAYRAAMACSSGAAEPVANLGLLYLQLGRRAEAVAALRQAIGLQPGFVKAVRPLAYLEMESGDLPAAARLVFGYFQQFPGLPEARTLMARYYLSVALQAAHRQDNAGVEQACRQGLGIVPESAELTGFLGVNYLQQGRLDEALKLLETSYRRQPADLRVAMVLAELYIRLGRGDDARGVLSAARTSAEKRNDRAAADRIDSLLRQLL